MEKCPACERKFESIGDFPRILITKVERLEIPDRILENHPICLPSKVRRFPFGKRDNPKLPKEVLEKFRGSNSLFVDIFWNGKFYKRFVNGDSGVCYIYNDIGPVVKPLVALPEVEQTLVALESLVGQEFKPSELPYDSYNKLIRKEFDKYKNIRFSLCGLLGGIYLSLLGDSVEPPHRGYEYMNYGGKDSIDVYLAKLYYEGIINQR